MCALQQGLVVYLLYLVLVPHPHLSSAKYGQIIHGSLSRQCSYVTHMHPPMMTKMWNIGEPISSFWLRTWQQIDNLHMINFQYSFSLNYDCKAVGLDGISPKLLYFGATALATGHTGFLSLLISTGIIPANWKTANMVPIHNKGSLQDRGIFSPISILSTLSILLYQYPTPFGSIGFSKFILLWKCSPQYSQQMGLLL